ncbi:MAG: type II secretion system F family protein, partial [Acidimicrobiales bacterium]
MTSAVAAALAVLAAGALARAARGLSRRHLVSGRLAGPGPGAPAAETGLVARAHRALPASPARVAAALADADVPVPAEVAWSGWLATLVIGALAALVIGGPGLATVVALALVAGPALVVRSRRGRADARIEQALPMALEAVARSLRSGASLRQAVEEAGRSGAGAGRALAGELARA